MPKPNNTQEQAYELALNRKIGGIMPYSLYEQSSKPKTHRKKKITKKKPSRKEWVANTKQLVKARNKRYYEKKKANAEGQRDHNLPRTTLHPDQITVTRPTQNK